MNIRQLAGKRGAMNVLMNAVSMVVDEISEKEKLTERERYLLEAWDEYHRRKENGGYHCEYCKDIGEWCEECGEHCEDVVLVPHGNRTLCVECSANEDVMAREREGRG